MALSLYRRRIPWILAAALILAALFAATASADTDQATSSQENAGHTGFASGGTLDQPPLSLAWSSNLGGSLTDPLIANGLVYVIEDDSQHAGALLDAVNTSTGALVWQRPVTSGAQIAYDNGSLFIAESNATVTAVDSATGDMSWTESLTNDSSPSIVAAGGTLYIGSNSWSSGLYALDESTGKAEWQESADDDGTLALDGTFLYAGAATAFTAATGHEAWIGNTSGSCYYTNALAADGGHLFQSCGGELNAANGSLLDTVPTNEPPAIAGGTGVFLSGATLEAVNLTTGVLEWQYTGTGLEGPPLIVNDTVYIGASSGTLYALNLDTGVQVWSASMGSAALGNSALPGMASANGLLVVPYGSTLEAFQSAAPRPGLDLRITSGPTGPTNSANAGFSFSSDDPTAPESCQLDGGAWTPCSQSETYSGLADGPHAFAVKTTDASDGSTIGLASQTWSVDTTVPKTTFVEQPAAVAHGSSFAFEFTSNDNQAQFHCSLDGQSETCTGFGNSSFQTPWNLADGSHTFSVTATGPLGTVGPAASVTWTVDDNLPVVTINSSPPSSTSATSATFTFSSKSTTNVTYQCAVASNNQGYYYSYYPGEYTGPWTACNSPYQTSGLSPGSYSFLVQATDQAGNVGTATYQWTITGPPQPTTPYIGSGPPPYVNSTTATFVFSSETSGETFQCSLDGATPQSCTSPDTFENIGAGAHTFQVYGVLSGTVGQPPASYSWTVRTEPPQVAIDGDTFPGPGSVAFYFHADEQAWFMCEIDTDGAWPCSSPVEYSNLTEGQHTFTVYGTDAAGNVSQPISKQFTITVPATNHPQDGQVAPQISSRSVVRALARQAADEVEHAPLHELSKGVPMLVAATGAGRTRVTVVSPASHHQRSIVLAQAGASFKKLGTRAVKLRLTGAGRRWVHAHPHAHVLVVVTFISGAAKVVVAESRAQL